jgi:hypothetical protein
MLYSTSNGALSRSFMNTTELLQGSHVRMLHTGLERGAHARMFFSVLDKSEHVDLELASARVFRRTRTMETSHRCYNEASMKTIQNSKSSTEIGRMERLAEVLKGLGTAE